MRHFNEAKKAVIIWQYQYFIVDTAIAVTSLVGHVANVTDFQTLRFDSLQPRFLLSVVVIPLPP